MSCPISTPSPWQRLNTELNPFAFNTSAIILVVAIETSGVLGAPFHKMRSPQTNPMIAFHPKTAHGKLKAEITPTIPSGFQFSSMKCPGLSEGRIFPSKDLDNPQAKSQISMTSWTSPSPSALILPISKLMRLPSASLYSLNFSPICLTISPLAGAGVSIQRSFSASIEVMQSSYCSAVASRTLEVTELSCGLMLVTSVSPAAHSPLV
mmetsp:Transcript_42393/g.49430  ORF Transcript_42393/g.49430 Transcript_42393/m.49430 type:complete len:208 (-) Transcript_42393:74-697(-)